MRAYEIQGGCGFEHLKQVDRPPPAAGIVLPSRAVCCTRGRQALGMWGWRVTARTWAFVIRRAGSGLVL